MNKVIEIKNLTKNYGKNRGIIDVSFDVFEKEIFGFIGPNGAGKSTTIRTLLSLIHPTSGEAKIFGLDCIENAEQIAKDVGYLPSEVFYYDGMKAIDLLNYAASFYDKDCNAKINDLAKRLNLDLNRKIEDLSFGNKKKVGIIQGLLHSPKLIILDEPTNGLDPLMQQTFFDILKEESDRGATILFSSHILSEVQKMCSRVAIIKDGKIIAVQEMSSLQSDSYKKIQITTNENIETSFFEIEGISNLKINTNQINFLFKGNINQIIAKLNSISIVDLIIEEPTLDEIFLHYYQ